MTFIETKMLYCVKMWYSHTKLPMYVFILSILKSKLHLFICFVSHIQLCKVRRHSRNNLPILLQLHTGNIQNKLDQAMVSLSCLKICCRCCYSFFRKHSLLKFYTLYLFFCLVQSSVGFSKDKLLKLLIELETLTFTFCLFVSYKCIQLFF